jgi:hypothetical protein
MTRVQTIAAVAIGLLASGAALAGESAVPLPVPGALALIAAGVGALYLFRRK